MRNNLGFCRTIQLAYADAVPAVTQSLQKEGFSVLTEIDVQATFKKKLDVDYRPYVILGACNPNLAHQALEAKSEWGLFLPCNVVVYDAGDGTSTVCIVDPIQMLGRVNDPELQPIADELNRRLWRVYLDMILRASPGLES